NRKNKIWMASCCIVSEFGINLDTPFAPETFDDQIMSLDMAAWAKLTEPLAPMRQVADLGQLSHRVRWMQYRDPVRLRRLLRPCSMWQYGYRTNESNELPPSHAPLLRTTQGTDLAYQLPNVMQLAARRSPCN